MYEYDDYEEAEQLEGDAASPCDTEQRYVMRQEADAAKVAEVLSILTATGFAAVRGGVVLERPAPEDGDALVRPRRAQLAAADTRLSISSLLWIGR
jgi:hypothetical protein